MICQCCTSDAKVILTLTDEGGIGIDNHFIALCDDCITNILARQFMLHKIPRRNVFG